MMKKRAAAESKSKRKAPPRVANASVETTEAAFEYSYAKEIARGSMSELSWRANYEVRTVRQKPLVLYEDHRSLLYVLWHAMHQAKDLVEPPLLIYFDAHDDAKPIAAGALPSIRRIRAGEATAREVFGFVEWELSPLDDDWLLAGMELGLIGDAICIGAKSTTNFDVRNAKRAEALTAAKVRAEFRAHHGPPDTPGIVGAHDRLQLKYVDYVGHEHRIWPLGHLWSELRSRGALEDGVRSDYFGSLWEVLGWDCLGHSFEKRDGLAPIVLDFDLDCFAGHMDSVTMAWPEELFRRFGDVAEAGVRWTAQQFLDAIESRVAFRTIARESPYCGGTLDSQRILMHLDDALWGGELMRRW